MGEKVVLLRGGYPLDPIQHGSNPGLDDGPSSNAQRDLTHGTVASLNTVRVLLYGGQRFVTVGYCAIRVYFVYHLLKMSRCRLHRFQFLALQDPSFIIPNDIFAGVNIYSEALPESCLTEVYTWCSGSRRTPMTRGVEPTPLVLNLERPCFHEGITCLLFDSS